MRPSDFQAICHDLQSAAEKPSDVVRSVISVLNEYFPKGDSRSLADDSFKIDAFIALYHLYRAARKGALDNRIANQVDQLYKSLLGTFNSMQAVAQFCLNNRAEKKINQAKASRHSLEAVIP